MSKEEDVFAGSSTMRISIHNGCETEKRIAHHIKLPPISEDPTMKSFSPSPFPDPCPPNTLKKAILFENPASRPVTDRVLLHVERMRNAEKETCGLFFWKPGHFYSIHPIFDGHQALKPWDSLTSFFSRVSKEYDDEILAL